MGFGLDIKQKPIETPKEDWMEFEGIYYPPRVVAAKKAWQTRKRNKHYKKYKTRTKDEQREIILNLMLDAEKNWFEYNHKRYTGLYPYAIILESPELLFLKKFIQESNGSNIHICIPNEKDYNKFKHTKNCYGCRNIWGEHQIEGFNNGWWDKKILLFNETYLDFIKRHLSNNKQIDDNFSICMIWADYCGAFSTHREDIDSTFQSMLLGNHSYYVITFCTRDPGKKNIKNYSKTNCIVAVNDFVSKCAKKYGYEVELLPESGLYKHHMYTAIFLVKYELMDKAKKEITKLLEEQIELRNLIRHKIKDLDNLINGVIRTGTQCPICKRWFVNISAHLSWCEKDKLK